MVNGVKTLCDTTLDLHIPRCSSSQYKVLISGHFLQRYINYKHIVHTKSSAVCKLYRVYSFFFLAFMLLCSFKLISFLAKLYNNINEYNNYTIKWVYLRNEHFFSHHISLKQKKFCVFIKVSQARTTVHCTVLLYIYLVASTRGSVLYRHTDTCTLYCTAIYIFSC